MLSYFSDHGDFIGSHGLSMKKSHPHEESVRVPAICHWSGVIPASGNVDYLFGLVGMMATTLGQAGLPILPWNQGRDCSAVLLGKEFTRPEAILLEMVGGPRVTLNWSD